MGMMKTDLQKWIRKYENKTGEKFEPCSGFKLFYLPDRGFCEVSFAPNMIIAKQMCGDAVFWRNCLEVLCQSTGYDHVGTYCIRDILPYIRLFGFHVERTEDTLEGKRYFCIDKNGKSGQCSPAWITAKGKRAYYITWEV